MASSSVQEQLNAERRSKVLVGSLPPDFLRIGKTSQEQQEAADQQAALALQQQQLMRNTSNPFVQNPVGKLNITIVQAKLVKNYGFPRMDPYVRLRVGHYVIETHTDGNGGKTPHWNKVVQCLLPQGVKSINVEIYDEKSFTMDEIVAWANIPISQAVLSGETHEDWYLLNGKQGEGKEGAINLVLSYTSGAVGAPPYMYGPGMVQPVVMVPSTERNMFGIPQFSPVPVYTQMPVEAPTYNEQDVAQIEEMFQGLGKEVIRSVYEANGFHKERTINTLLQMSA